MMFLFSVKRILGVVTRVSRVYPINFNVRRVYNSAVSVVTSNWILATGFWNDSGVWEDTATWID